MAAAPRADAVWRLRGRRAFADLRARGRRSRSGPVAVTFLADGAELPPRVAYAVGRPVGTAVVRNQVRRRLRAAVAEHHRGPGGPLPSGSYLVAARPEAATLAPTDLKANLSRAMQAATQPRSER